jgi:hypothetical protein
MLNLLLMLLLPLMPTIAYPPLHRWGRYELSDTTVLARVNLRELARRVEEIAVVLENEGFRTMPGELLAISERLTSVREALEKVTGTAK